MTHAAERLPVPSEPATGDAYPMVRGGGLFLLLFGLGFVASIAFRGDALVNGRVFLAGVVVALLSLSAAKRLSYGAPTRVQIVALLSAVVLEVILFYALARTLPAGAAERVQWSWVLIIVGIHFLPMALSFGPRMLLLGAACIANGAVALLLPAVPYATVGLIDGGLKCAFGVWLLSTRPPPGAGRSPGGRRAPWEDR